MIWFQNKKYTPEYIAERFVEIDLQFRRGVRRMIQVAMGAVGIMIALHVVLIESELPW